jgi:hypothetical protein
MAGRTVKVQVAVDVTSDVRDFHVRIKREIYQNGALVREREWLEDIPRDFQ